jgi:hypothetical protein
MRNWFAGFRISTALDSGTSGKELLRNQRDEIRRYEVSMQSLDRRLKAARPAQPVPDTLHASIMRGVCAAADARERQAAPRILSWLPAPALALLTGLAVWWSVTRPPHDSPSLAAATSALEQSHEITQNAPAAVLAPLSQEMEYLNRDFQNAMEFLIASVP